MAQGPITKLKLRISELETELRQARRERDALREQLEMLQEWRADQNSIARKFDEDFGGDHITPIEEIESG